MVRYLALATVIVLVALALGLGFPRRGPSPGASPRYAQSSAKPRADRFGSAPRTPEPVTGDAPWALSAVPECFRERVAYSGSPAFVRAHLPAGSRAVGGSFRLASADCVVLVRGDSVELVRGENRLTIPPPATLYVLRSGLALRERFGNRERLRIYAFVR